MTVLHDDVMTILYFALPDLAFVALIPAFVLLQ